MDKRFKRIDMELVRKIIVERGFYYLPLDKIYDNFIGCKYIVVTDDVNFLKKNPEFADEIIITLDEFKGYAETFNAFLANEDRERKRQKLHNDKDYSELDEANLKIFDFDSNPVENEVFKHLQNKKIYSGLMKLSEIQRKRVVLFYVYGWTERQIAEHEGVNRYAVRRSLEQSMKKLKKIF